MTLTPHQTSPHSTAAQRESASRNRQTTPRITCGGCDNTWTGTHRAHCSVCHHTFNSPWLFDRHRRHGHCLDPADLGFDQVNGVWRETGRDFDPAQAFHGDHQ